MKNVIARFFAEMGLALGFFSINTEFFSIKWYRKPDQNDSSKKSGRE
jgi:hypothetical protein